MPNLLDFPDGNAVEDRWSGRPVVYVEDKADEEVFRRLMGGATNDLEFKPPQSGTGCTAVLSQVAKDRPINRRVFGLVDGETVARLGYVDALLDCNDNFFIAPPETKTDGVLFLSSHELENVLLQHGDLENHVSHDARLGELDKVTPYDVQATLNCLAKRYLFGAILNYAVAIIANTGAEVPKIENGYFLNPKLSMMEIVLLVRQRLKAVKADWPTFRREALRIAARIRRHSYTTVAPPEDTVLRLADGKGLLAGMKQVFNRHARWEGQLTKTVMASDYGQDFRNTLIAFTKAA